MNIPDEYIKTALIPLNYCITYNTQPTITLFLND